LGLLEALQLQHKSEDTDKVTEEKPRTKKKKRKGTRTESVSPRDEGYNTSNEKIYDIFELNNEDSDEWNLAETDDDLDEIKPRRNNDDDIPIKMCPTYKKSDCHNRNLFNQMTPVIPVTWRRSSPEEDFMWTLQGVQTLLEQQNKILIKFNSSFVSCQVSNTTGGLTIPRPKFETKIEENSDRRSETEELKQFQRSIEEKLDRKRNRIYDICDL